MKQFRIFGALLTIILSAFSILLLTQCGSPAQPQSCNLAPPNVGRVDSIVNNQTYISWSQVIGNNGYRVRIVPLDTLLPAILDTTVAANDTNFVANNLPVNSRLEARIYTICPNGESSKKFLPILLDDGIVIVDEPVMIPPIGSPDGCGKGFINCYNINNKPVTVNYLNTTVLNVLSFSISNFIATPRRHYHIIIKQGNTLLSEFRLINTSNSMYPTNKYFISSGCATNRPTNANYNISTKTFTWTVNGIQLRLIIDDSNNKVLLSSNQPCTYTVLSSIKYTIKCTQYKNTGIPNE